MEKNKRGIVIVLGAPDILNVVKIIIVQLYMGNNNYQRGVRFEREIVNAFSGTGWMSARTAGSHGYFDVVLIHPKLKEVKFIQCKVKKGNKNLSKNLHRPKGLVIKGKWKVDFEKWTKWTR